MARLSAGSQCEETGLRSHRQDFIYRRKEASQSNGLRVQDCFLSSSCMVMPQLYFSFSLGTPFDSSRQSTEQFRHKYAIFVQPRRTHRVPFFSSWFLPTSVSLRMHHGIIRSTHLSVFRATNGIIVFLTWLCQIGFTHFLAPQVQTVVSPSILDRFAWNLNCTLSYM
jgi:hypothetical protein